MASQNTTLEPCDLDRECTDRACVKSHTNGICEYGSKNCKLVTCRRRHVSKYISKLCVNGGDCFSRKTGCEYRHLDDACEYGGKCLISPCHFVHPVDIRRNVPCVYGYGCPQMDICVKLHCPIERRPMCANPDCCEKRCTYMHDDGHTCISNFGRMVHNFRTVIIPNDEVRPLDIKRGTRDLQVMVPEHVPSEKAVRAQYSEAYHMAQQMAQQIAHPMAEQIAYPFAYQMAFSMAYPMAYQMAHEMVYAMQHGMPYQMPYQQSNTGDTAEIQTMDRQT